MGTARRLALMMEQPAWPGVAASLRSAPRQSGATDAQRKLWR